MAYVNVVSLLSIAVLRSTGNGPTNPVIWIEGYTSPADGGEGMFVYAPGDTSSPDNGGTVIVTTSGGYRYYRETNKGPLNICWFGASTNAGVDSSPALNAALAALPAAGGQILVPTGTFTLNSAITYTTPSSSAIFSLAIVGLGADVSNLYWANATNGIALNVSLASHSVHVRDLSIVTSQSCGYTGILVTLTSIQNQFEQNDFINVNFRGRSVNAQYWGNGLIISGLSNVTYNNVLYFGGNASGTGIVIQTGPASSTFCIVHNLTDCGFFFGQNGLVYGNGVQGVTVSQCNFTGGVTGIIQPTGPGGFQLTVQGSQFNTTQNQIYLQTTIAGLSIIGNLFFVPNATGANYAGVNLSTNFIRGVTIQGNVFLGSPPASGQPLTGAGVITGPNTYDGVVSGNSFYDVQVGVNLTGATNWNVLGNVYDTTVITKVIPGSGNSVGVATA